MKEEWEQVNEHVKRRKKPQAPAVEPKVMVKKQKKSKEAK